jgi:hypothetical protein
MLCFVPLMRRKQTYKAMFARILLSQVFKLNIIIAKGTTLVKRERYCTGYQPSARIPEP